MGVRRRPSLGVPEGFERVAGPESLRALLAVADAVVLAAPATERTTGLIGAGELAAMKPGALLCNVARGSLVDEDALVTALESGHLGAAVLDVTAHEPLSRRSRLWAAPRAYLSPHVANAWRPEYVAAVLGLLAENVARHQRGEPLRNEVDLEQGY
jgi:phosphoglycerate dehydrogenase-like enzyme